MSLYNKLKSIWKKLDINGQVINYSSKELWVIETKDGPVAHILRPGYKTPIKLDIDGFKRVDGKAIEKHKNWWKFYDFSTVDVFDNGAKLKISVITKIAVGEKHFEKPKYLKKSFGEAIRAIVDIKRNKKGVIEQYKISDIGWVSFDDALRMVCYHDIDNARPVFPKRGRPYIRSKRDKTILNNLSIKGRA